MFFFFFKVAGKQRNRPGFHFGFMFLVYLFYFLPGGAGCFFFFWNVSEEKKRKKKKFVKTNKLKWVK